MGTTTNTYILIGVALPERWGYLPSDGQGEQHEYDDWCDRYGDLVVYRPEPGQYVHFTNIDGEHPHLGKVIDVHHLRETNYTTFNEVFDVERLSKEIDEVARYLQDTFGITDPVKLHIISNHT